MSETKSSFLKRKNLLLAAIVTVGIVVPGVARRLLGEAGYDTIGMFVFVLGYAGMVFLVWYGWIRPLDITGPASE